MQQNEIMLFFAFALVMLVLFGLIVYLQNKHLKSLLQAQKPDESVNIIGQWMQEMRGSIDRTSGMIQQQLNMTQEAVSSRLDNTAQLMRLLNRDLGQIHEIGQQMRDFQKIFRSPKLRGNVGENILKDLLYQILPKENIKLQHRFRNGQIVDALIITENNSIPIDSKFPLENFSKAQNATNPEEEKLYKREFFRDARRHIDAISQKYIRPEEDTLDFAIMYIPSETIYYETISNDAIMTYARDKNILLISPNNFYYFLKVIMLGLEGKRIEETSRRIIQTLRALRQDASKVTNDIKILNSHINNAKNASERLNSDFLNMVGKIENESGH